MQTKLLAYNARRAIQAAALLSRRVPRRVTLPEQVIQGAPRPRYDTDLAWELLSSTAEFPGTRSGMLAVLHEYRYALHDALTALSAHTEQADMQIVIRRQ